MVHRRFLLRRPVLPVIREEVFEATSNFPVQTEDHFKGQGGTVHAILQRTAIRQREAWGKNDSHGGGEVSPPSLDATHPAARSPSSPPHGGSGGRAKERQDSASSRDRRTSPSPHIGNGLGPRKREATSSVAEALCWNPPELAFPSAQQSKEDSEARTSSAREREEKLRMLREKQEEDRTRKAEELKAHAAAAQRFREEQERERQRRIEEARSREADRLRSVVERRDAMMEAERERKLEAISKRNTEVESRLSAKRRHNERNVFAFGSCTPRMPDTPPPASTAWSAKRSSSIINMAGGDSQFSSNTNNTMSSSTVDSGARGASPGSGYNKQSAPEGIRASTSMNFDRKNLQECSCDWYSWKPRPLTVAFAETGQSHSWTVVSPKPEKLWPTQPSKRNRKDLFLPLRNSASGGVLAAGFSCQFSSVAVLAFRASHLVTLFAHWAVMAVQTIISLNRERLLAKFSTECIYSDSQPSLLSSQWS
ncbi:unnamed protein product [Cyprideis torosa]|uniref:Uncharacterized protein n=1 Tax=Cyprideis torosa TaxID=163714 RepID=A0A7R8W455_9CRUS|nr:unnamed protein product [Cyprideis torosa]CAG0883799.1 unnamed protein product [Cyprideis torosa]